LQNDTGPFDSIQFALPLHERCVNNYQIPSIVKIGWLEYVYIKLHWDIQQITRGQRRERKRFNNCDLRCANRSSHDFSRSFCCPFHFDFPRTGCHP